MLFKREDKWEHIHANWLDLSENLSRKMPYTSVQGHCKSQPEMNKAVPFLKSFSQVSIASEGHLPFYFFYELKYSKIKF